MSVVGRLFGGFGIGLSDVIGFGCMCNMGINTDDTLSTFGKLVPNYAAQKKGGDDHIGFHL